VAVLAQMEVTQYLVLFQLLPLAEVLVAYLVLLVLLAGQVVAVAVKLHLLVEVEHLGKEMLVALVVLVLVLITHQAVVEAQVLSVEMPTILE
jgi:hypothetical protein